MCPLACRARRIKEYEKYPQHVRALEIAIDKHLEEKRREEKRNGLFDWGSNGKEIVYRWVYEAPIESAKGSCMQPLGEDD